jgi:hypothetical protein
MINEVKLAPMRPKTRGHKLESGNPTGPWTSSEHFSGNVVVVRAIAKISEEKNLRRERQNLKEFSSCLLCC